METNNMDKKLTFSPKITQAIKAKLYEFDGVRINILKKKKIVWAIFGVLVVIASSVAWSLEIPQVLFAIPFFAFFGIGYISVTKGKLAEEFKNEILTKQMESIDEVKYHANDSISLSEFYESNIYHNRIDRYSGEDLFEGKKDKTTYKFSEILAEEKHTTTDSKGRTKTTWVTIFNGIMMIADFNKIIKSETRVIQRSESFFNKWFKNKTKVELESPEFEKMFETYSQDQVEARYILTPSMMERILKLQKSMGSKVHLSFNGSKVYIAISNSYNFFEADLDQPINSEQIERIFGEIRECIEIIDILDLNTRIWTKK